VVRPGHPGRDPNLYRYCGNDPVNATDPSGTVAIAIPVVAFILVAALTVVVLNGSGGSSSGFGQILSDTLQGTWETITGIGIWASESVGRLGDGLGELIRPRPIDVAPPPLGVPTRERDDEHVRGKRDAIEISKGEREDWETTPWNERDEDEWGTPEHPGGAAGRKGYPQPHNIRPPRP
jgi:hypothetical protein